jgi:putative DNA primase/helicase
LQIKQSLVVPLYNANMDVTSLQFIQQGSKRFLKGGKKEGSFFIFGSLNLNNNTNSNTSSNNKVYIAEGIATAASIYEATNTTTICVFDAGKLTGNRMDVFKEAAFLNIKGI